MHRLHADKAKRAHIIRGISYSIKDTSVIPTPNVPNALGHPYIARQQILVTRVFNAYGGQWYYLQLWFTLPPMSRPCHRCYPTCMPRSPHRWIQLSDLYPLQPPPHPPASLALRELSHNPDYTNTRAISMKDQFRLENSRARYSIEA